MTTTLNHFGYIRKLGDRFIATTPDGSSDLICNTWLESIAFLMAERLKKDI